MKARFGRGGGRVTELTAKPMLKVFFPELADFGQPLGGTDCGAALAAAAADLRGRLRRRHRPAGRRPPRRRAAGRGRHRFARTRQPAAAGPHGDGQRGLARHLHAGARRRPPARRADHGDVRDPAPGHGGAGLHPHATPRPPAADAAGHGRHAHARRALPSSWPAPPARKRRWPSCSTTPRTTPPRAASASRRCSASCTGSSSNVSRTRADPPRRHRLRQPLAAVRLHGGRGQRQLFRRRGHPATSRLRRLRAGAHDAVRCRGLQRPAAAQSGLPAARRRRPARCARAMCCAASAARIGRAAAARVLGRGRQRQRSGPAAGWPTAPSRSNPSRRAAHEPGVTVVSFDELCRLCPKRRCAPRRALARSLRGRVPA